MRKECTYALRRSFTVISSLFFSHGKKKNNYSLRVCRGGEWLKHVGLILAKSCHINICRSDVSENTNKKTDRKPNCFLNGLFCVFEFDGEFLTGCFFRGFFFYENEFGGPETHSKRNWGNVRQGHTKMCYMYMLHVLVWGRDSEYTNCHKGAWKIKKCNGGFQCFFKSKRKGLGNCILPYTVCMAAKRCIP